MPYGQYENTSFNGQTFTLGNVGLTGATGPDLVSSDPSKPVRVNGIVPSAGGGGGGDVFTSTNNTYDAGIVNTFQGNTVMTTVGASGKITCVALDAGNGKIETTADVECEGLNAGAAKIETTDNVECADVIASANVQCVDVDASGDLTCVGVAATTLTTSGDINTGVGNIISGGSITAASISTNSSGSITSAGDIVATSGTGFIHGKSLLSDTNISCGAGGNYFVGSTQIASSNLLDGSLLLNTSAAAQTKAGTLAATELRATNGAVNFTAGTGANIQNDTTNNVLLTSTTNLTDGMNWRLGTGSADTLRLRYDASGGGAGIPRYFLEMLNPTDSQYYAFSGNSPYDVAGLTALLNNTSLTFNGTTTTTFDAGSNVLLNGTTTVATTKDIISPDLLSGTQGLITTANQTINRSLTAWQPTITNLVPISGYNNAITNLFVCSFARVQFGTNWYINFRGGIQPNGAGATFPSGNLTIANMGATYAPAQNMYFGYQLQPGVPGGFMNLTPTGDFILIGLSGTETQIYFGGVSYFVD